MMDTSVGMATSRNAMIVDLGPFREAVEKRVEAGSYSSPDEVIQAGLQALECGKSGLNGWLTQRAEEPFADPEPNIPAAEVFRELRAIHREAARKSTC